ncbi:sulfatase [Polaribacter sargassicola]|uniref:sulfatase n=1 Tax=Polaribacter sargassicola TaxID=2836891 RepID=UPI001F3CB8BC|nr:sulfatase [Polaribacter sp. DS7-9]MCG1035780.1 sulfatase [Polaribacter sp. DS7-9]
MKKNTKISPVFPIIFLLVFSLFGCKTKSEKVKHSAVKNPIKPNVLFILVDDLGYADLSVMGSKYYETPNIDKIAKSGSVFTNGYAACTVCSPSRASLLTGQSPARHGITQFEGRNLSGQAWKTKKRYTKLLPPEFNEHLDPNTLTLAEAFKEEGYATFFAGKWHLGSKEQKSLPTDHGFDVNIGGFQSGSPSGGYFSPYKNPNLPNLPEEKGQNLSMKLAKETSNFITKNKDKHFLAYLSFYAVHGPIQTTKEKWAKYRNKAEKMGIHENGFEMERVLPARKYQDNPVYAGLIEQVDDAVGSVLKTLKDLGLDKNTIIVFTSDNGGVTSGDNFSTNQLSLRGGKGYQWEGGIRIPYFIDVPWIKQNGGNINVPVSGTDLFPTLLDLSGLSLKPENHKDGVSLKPLLEGEKIDERPLYWHYPHYGNQGGEPSSIIRKGKWKLIYYWEDLHSELYNLETDLKETNNVAENNPKIANQMKTQLLTWLKSMGTHYATEDPLWDKEARQKWLENQKTKRLPSLEKERKEMLSPDWQPNKDWWGSEVETK